MKGLSWKMKKYRLLLKRFIIDRCQSLKLRSTFMVTMAGEMIQHDLTVYILTTWV